MTEFADAIQDETIDTEPPPARDTYEELVEVTLTEEEKAARRIELESIDREIIRLEEQKKADNKVINGEIKVQKARKDGILAALDAGTEKRPVECYEHVVEDNGGNILRVEVRRVDSDEVVEERAATEEERRDHAASKQGNLFDGDRHLSGTEASDDDFELASDDEDFEPTPEALAQAAEDEGRVVKTSSAEVKKKRASKSKSNGSAEA